MLSRADPTDNRIDVCIYHIIDDLPLLCFVIVLDFLFRTASHQQKSIRRIAPAHDINVQIRSQKLLRFRIKNMHALVIHSEDQIMRQTSIASILWSSDGVVDLLLGCCHVPVRHKTTNHRPSSSRTISNTRVWPAAETSSEELYTLS